MGGFILLTIILVALFLGLFVSMAVSVSKVRLELPPDAPAAVLERERERAGDPGAAGNGAQRARRVVCAGDSITQGAISVSYVEMLKRMRPDLEFVNAGVNSELAYNLAERLADIVACGPDYVTILIGTNDVNATLGFKNAFGYLAMNRLPEPPSAEFYRQNLTGIVRRLKAETRARIALVSLPPLGEDLSHYANIRTEEYSRIIREIAAAEGADYLPLNESMRAYLEKIPGRRPEPLSAAGKHMASAMRDHGFLGKSWDEISAANGYALLIDGIHLNTHGAAILASLIGGFLS
jgi:lysophospholipase L1-like esterase